MLFVLNLPYRFTAPWEYQSQTASKAILGITSILLYLRVLYFFSASEYLGVTV